MIHNSVISVWFVFQVIGKQVLVETTLRPVWWRKRRRRRWWWVVLMIPMRL